MIHTAEKKTITQRDRIGGVTVGHIACKRSGFVYYVLQEGDSVTGTVASLQYQVSRIPDVGLEIPIQMTFTHSSKPIIGKMKLYVEFHLMKMEQEFCLENDEENPDDETKDIIFYDDGDEELIQGGGISGEAGTSTGPVVIVIDDEQQINAESEDKFEKVCKGRSMKP